MDELVIIPPATTYEWLSSVPLAASAGNAVYNFYEGSKNCSRVTQYALGTVESSVSMVASVAAPVVKKLDKPIQVVDSYTVSTLVKLEEKVPAVKSQPEEVVAYLTQTKDAVANKITESRTAISTRITESKDSISGHITSGKEAVYNRISAGSEVIVNSRAGVLVGEGKQALASRLNQGKEALSSSITSGRDAVYTSIQSGAESLANTRAGTLVGSGVNKTLSATENLVEYLIPELEINLSVECENKDEMESPSPTTDDSPAQDEESLPEDECETGRIERVYTLSRKVRDRMYYRSMQRLHTMQLNCSSTLQQLKQAVDLLKVAQAARDGVDKQYQSVTTSLQNLEGQIKQLLSHQSKESIETDEDDVKIEWISPKPQGALQSSLDYAKQLSDKVFHTFQSLTVATTYLPQNMKGGANQAYQYAQEMYSTLKPVEVPTDLPSTTLARLSTLLETQLGYVSQLGVYLTSALQRRKALDLPPVGDDDDESEGNKEPVENEEPVEN